MPNGVTLSISSFEKEAEIFRALLPIKAAFLYAQNKAATHTNEQIQLTVTLLSSFQNRAKVIFLTALSKAGLSEIPRPRYVYQRRNQ